MNENHSEAVEIPWEMLSPDALTGVLESFVLREGTDYGEVELSFEAKVARLRAAVEHREARILFDSETETVTISSETDSSAFRR
jgi:uncharacterized protein YheU (UPF0270 family)